MSASLRGYHDIVQQLLEATASPDIQQKVAMNAVHIIYLLTTLTDRAKAGICICMKCHAGE